MAKAALRDVSKATVAEPINTLAALIDEAGRVNAERSALDKAYRKLREAIEAQMDIPTTKEPTRIDGEEFYANLKFHTQKSVDIKTLFKRHPSVFWALADVPVKALEDSLGPEEAHGLVGVGYKNVPTLSIERKKN